jgi:hypothetical protein
MATTSNRAGEPAIFRSYIQASAALYTSSFFFSVINSAGSPKAVFLRSFTSTKTMAVSS